MADRIDHLKTALADRYIIERELGAGGMATVYLYFANGFNLAHPALSPDGRWMAYDSDESGRVKVYAQSFPDPSVGRWKVSPARGSMSCSNGSTSSA